MTTKKKTEIYHSCEVYGEDTLYGIIFFRTFCKSCKKESGGRDWSCGMVYSAPWQHFSTQCAISLAVYGPKTRFCI
jgi:hypothetical protein